MPSYQSIFYNTPRTRWKSIVLCIVPPLVATIATLSLVILIVLQIYSADSYYEEQNPSRSIQSQQPSFFSATLSPSITSSSPIPTIRDNSKNKSVRTLQPSAKPSTIRIQNKPLTRIITTSPTPNYSLPPSVNISEFPTKYPSDRPSKEEGVHPLSFYVLGDIPYNRKEQKVFTRQLQDIQDLIANNEDNSRFIVHVGDLMSAHFSKCREERYRTISTIMKATTEIPVLTTPGDNEWNRCPDLNLAVANYTKYFIGIEESWHEGQNNLSTMISRSISRPENWVLNHSDVLFLAINMVHSENDLDSANKRIQDNLEWFEENCNKYCADARAIIFFGHSITKADEFFERINKRLLQLNIPTIYFTGHGHDFFVKRGVGRGEMPGDFFWRVQVDNGIKAPPLKVTIRGNDELLSIATDDFDNLGDNQVILGNMIKIDRREGLYSNRS